jgi:hypothetical protein
VRPRNDRLKQPRRPTARVRAFVFAALRPTPLCAGDDVAGVCGSCGIELDRHSVPTYGRRTRDDGLPLCRFAQVSRRDAAMLDILESDREGNSHERWLDSSGARGVWGDREGDRMVLRTRPAIRSRIRQPSLACRTTFLSDDQAATITNPALNTAALPARPIGSEIEERQMADDRLASVGSTAAIRSAAGDLSPHGVWT